MADYIIVKFFEEMSFRTKGAQRERYPAWGKVTIQRTGGGKFGKQAHLARISKEKARALIARRGLVEVHRDENGIVYDTPDKIFQKANGGGRTYIPPYQSLEGSR